MALTPIFMFQTIDPAHISFEIRRFHVFSSKFQHPRSISAFLSPLCEVGHEEKNLSEDIPAISFSVMIISSTYITNKMIPA